MMNRALKVGGVALAIVSATVVRAQAGGPVTLATTGPKKVWLRLEALNEGVVRLWYADSPGFKRKTWLAMKAAPKGRVALRRAGRTGRSCT